MGLWKSIKNIFAKKKSRSPQPSVRSMPTYSRTPNSDTMSNDFERGKSGVERPNTQRLQSDQRADLMKQLNREKQKSRYRYFGKNTARGVKNAMQDVAREMADVAKNGRLKTAYPYGLDQSYTNRKNGKLADMTNEEIKALLDKIKDFNEHTNTPEKRLAYTGEQAIFAAVSSLTRHIGSVDAFNMKMESITKLYMQRFGVTREEAEDGVTENIRKSFGELEEDINEGKEKGIAGAGDGYE